MPWSILTPLFVFVVYGGNLFAGLVLLPYALIKGAELKPRTFTIGLLFIYFLLLMFANAAHDEKIYWANMRYLADAYR